MADRIYDSSWYEGQAGPSAQSAAVVVPVLIEHVQPRSVIDVGCGVGTWLAAFTASGVVSVRGIDGAYVDRSLLRIDEEQFLAMDLRSPSPAGQYDLAVCLEVGEHLPAESADGLVRMLVESAPVVFFGAAIPGQGGRHHINEQWQSYWAGLFAKHDYRPTDVIRRRYWGDRRIEFHYLQNALLYSEAGVLGEPVEVLDVVHPRMLEEPGLRRALSQTERAIRHRTGQFLRRLTRRSPRN